MKKFCATFLLVALFCSAKSYAAWSELSRDTSDATITLSSVTTRVRTIIDDRNSTNGTIRYSSSTIYSLINNAQRMFCITSRALEANATDDLVAGTTEYSLPSDCLYLERVTLDINDNNGPQYIPQKTVWGLDLESTQWAVETSSPAAYYIRNQKIGMYPFPAYSGAELEIWYIRYPADMSAESSYVFEGHTQLEPYWEALASYAAYNIFVMEGKLQLAAQYAEVWTQMLGMFTGVYRENPNRTPSTSGTEYREMNRSSGGR